MPCILPNAPTPRPSAVVVPRPPAVSVPHRQSTATKYAQTRVSKVRSHKAAGAGAGAGAAAAGACTPFALRPAAGPLRMSTAAVTAGRPPTATVQPKIQPRPAVSVRPALAVRPAASPVVVVAAVNVAKTNGDAGAKREAAAAAVGGGGVVAVTVATPGGGQVKRQQAIVKPHVLTHVIEGHVIQEAQEPFPVSALRCSSMSQRILLGHVISVVLL